MDEYYLKSLYIMSLLFNEWVIHRRLTMSPKEDTPSVKGGISIGVNQTLHARRSVQNYCGPG